jgi:hypothetical protein
MYFTLREWWWWMIGKCDLSLSIVIAQMKYTWYPTW